MNSFRGKVFIDFQNNLREPSLEQSNPYESFRVNTRNKEEIIDENCIEQRQAE